MATQSTLDILIRILGDTKGAEKIAKALDGIEKSSTKAGKSVKDFGSALSGGLLLKAGGIAGISLALGKFSIDSVKAGLEAEKLGKALNLLGNRFGLNGPKIAEAIELASGGTVSGLEAMELAIKEMAKLKPEKVWKDVADGADRTVESLTHAERQQALYNAALDGAIKKLQETGKSAEGATGAIDRLSAAWSNYTVEMGRGITPNEKYINLLADLVQGFADKAKNVQEAERAIKRFGLQQMELRGQSRNLINVTEILVEAQRLQQIATFEQEASALNLIKARNTLIDTTEDLTKAEEDNTEAMLRKAELFASLAELQQASIEAQKETEQAGLDLTKETLEERESLQKEFGTREQELIKGIAEAKTFEERGRLEQELNDLKQNHIDTLQELAQFEQDKQAELIAAQEADRALREQHLGEIVLMSVLKQAEANEKLEELVGIAGISAKDAFELITAGIIEISGATLEEVGTLGEDITANLEDTTSQATENMEAVVKAMGGAVDEVTSGAEQAADSAERAIDSVGDAINSLPSSKQINIEVHTSYTSSGSAGDRGGAIDNPSSPVMRRFAHGGDFIVPAGFPDDSFLMGVTSGERVTVQPQTTNNFNMNISSNAAVSSVVQDFQMMRAIVG